AVDAQLGKTVKDNFLDPAAHGDWNTFAGNLGDLAGSFAGLAATAVGGPEAISGLLRARSVAAEGEGGTYTATIKWGLRDVNVRPAGTGFWGERVPQADPAVDAYELQINPNNESYYLPHPNGGYVQFENLVGNTLQDGKLVTSPSSIYMVEDLPGFAQQAVL